MAKAPAGQPSVSFVESWDGLPSEPEYHYDGEIAA